MTDFASNSADMLDGMFRIMPYIFGMMVLMAFMSLIARLNTHQKSNKESNKNVKKNEIPVDNIKVQYDELINRVSKIKNEIENSNFLSNEMKVEFEFKLKNILLLIKEIETDKLKLNNEFILKVDKTVSNIENDIILAEFHDNKFNLNRKLNKIDIIEKI